ncbi:hypothetical protein PSHT_14867, partial [Puccinia striiformis]
MPADDKAFRELLLEIEISCSRDKRIPDIAGKKWGGQLKITYLANFGLQSGDFHPSLEPSIQHICALYHPIPFIRKSQVQHCQTPLEQDWFSHLLARLNELFPGQIFKWASSDEWHLSKLPNTLAPVNSHKGEEIFSSMKTNKNNCIIALKPEAKLKYGVIEQVFLHSRTPPGLPPQTNAWLALKPLNPAPTTNNPFTQLDKYVFDVSLQTLQEHPIYI